MESWARKLFRSCLLCLGGMLALSWAIGLLRSLLPWVCGLGAMTAAGLLLWRRFRRREDRW